MNLMSFYDPKHGQMHQFKDVRVMLDGTEAKVSNLNPGPGPKGTPIKGVSWKGDVKVGMFLGVNIASFQMAATYLLYRGFPVTGGFVRVNHPTMGEFVFDFRNIQGVSRGKKGITLKVYQVAEYKSAGISHPFQGELTLVMDKGDIERFGKLLDEVDEMKDMQNKERCGFCQAVTTMWLEKEGGRGCPFCLLSWSMMCMAGGPMLEKAMAGDQQGLQFIFVATTMLKAVAEKSPIRDPLMLADLNYMQAMLVFLVLFKDNKNVDAVLADAKALEALQKVREKLEEAYKVAKAANRQEAISIYGYQLGRIHHFLKHSDRAVELLEESSKIDLESSGMENYVKSENDVMIIYLEMKKYDIIFQKYWELHKKPEFLALTTPHPMRIMHTVLEAAIQANNPEVFGMTLVDLSAYADKTIGTKDAGKFATLQLQARWNEVRGDLAAAWDVYVSYLELGLQLDSVKGPQEARKSLERLRDKVDPRRVAEFDQKYPKRK